MTIEASPYVVEAARRDITAERTLVVMAAIENARAQMKRLRSIHNMDAAAAEELAKIFRAYEDYERVMKP